ncbi:MAG TPA: hypothetical protein VHA35_05790 [Dongiaceae bacterium]|jgi:hypothetical protein|nr:hypothetical protein [Dongiaceae bacterium]
MSVRSIMTAACAVLLLCACEGASEVQQGAKDYDNADRDAMQKQMQDLQRQAEQQRQQQELLKQLQQDCQNMPSLAQPEGPVRASDAGSLPGGAIMFAADMQLAWGSGGGGRGGNGGKGGRSTNCP